MVTHYKKIFWKNQFFYNFPLIFCIPLSGSCWVSQRVLVHRLQRRRWSHPSLPSTSLQNRLVSSHNLLSHHTHTTGFQALLGKKDPPTYFLMAHQKGFSSFCWILTVSPRSAWPVKSVSVDLNRGSLGVGALFVVLLQSDMLDQYQHRN